MFQMHVLSLLSCLFCIVCQFLYMMISFWKEWRSLVWVPYKIRVLVLVDQILLDQQSFMQLLPPNHTQTKSSHQFCGYNVGANRQTRHKRYVFILCTSFKKRARSIIMHVSVSINDPAYILKHQTQIPAGVVANRIDVSIKVTSPQSLSDSWGGTLE
jgi:hypothetical protein